MWHGFQMLIDDSMVTAVGEDDPVHPIHDRPAVSGLQPSFYKTREDLFKSLLEYDAVAPATEPFYGSFTMPEAPAELKEESRLLLRDLSLTLAIQRKGAEPVLRDCCQTPGCEWNHLLLNFPGGRGGAGACLDANPETVICHLNIQITYLELLVVFRSTMYNALSETESAIADQMR